ncbi:MAG: ribosome small subunit-dependent GTPase A [Gemmatimonadota bacterium]
MVRAAGTESLVEGTDGLYRCQLRGRLKEGVRATSSPIAAGDWVEFCLTAPGRGVIEAVAPRRSVLSRGASGQRSWEQVLAANLDRFFIVVSAREPAFNPGFVDRALVMALRGEVTPVVCINKVDLDPERRCLEAVQLYSGLGYEVLQTSALTGEGTDALRQQFAGRASALVGQSGVGKSSLLNQIEPGLSLATQELMSRHDRGRHTTAVTQLHALSIGGYVADTPGIKQLRPWGLTRSNLVEHFVEMAPLATTCQFRNCSHLHEPGCAIRESVLSGRIAPLRYESFCRMARGIEKAGE